MPLHEQDSRWKLSWVLLIFAIVAVAAMALFRLNLSLSVRLAGAVATTLTRATDSVDYSTISFLNRFAGRSWTVDKFFILIDGNYLATAPLLLSFWWAWFKEGEDQPRNREFAMYGILSSFVAVFAARMLAISLPYRERPLRNPLLHFQLPYDMRPDRVLGWSSFPSDHGALWFALAAGIFFISRRLSIFLGLYVCLTLAIARMYLGIHYPTDILAGGLIGIGVASLAKYPAIRTAVTRKPMEWANRAPQLFYAISFLLTAQMAESFASTHEIVEYLRTFAISVTKLF
ncbi:MAG TPA: phosphatase PAP2 family protein [Candidatus Acidoferrum sp.]|jgi:undecaprenyl-diphosphatase|nr:phosphatase PAP2 family protein [Candidatus Acidoferrum sp.]